ncbi:MAG: substrate-binding domain-containing protein [Eubacteriales bacterium]|nr:substrate-binding domain-containing protein [Eubacteriales bacterium]
MKKLVLILLAVSLLLLPACQATNLTTTPTVAVENLSETAVTEAVATTAAETAATEAATDATTATVTEVTTAETTAAIVTKMAKPANPVLRLSTTTSVNDSGLLPELEKRFEAKTGYQLDIIANGTGAAIKLGESGDADVLLVHAKASEDAFVASGFGLKRFPFMHNFFVIAGPDADPAGVATTKTAVNAFIAIATKEQIFVSRGDDSGTHKAEQKIWSTAGITPKGSWYVSAGAGMGACLTIAGEVQGYVLTDKATYLATKDQTGLVIKLGESTDLKNTYSMIAVNPDKNPGVNVIGAQAFIDYMLSDEAAALIKAFGVTEYGEQLFFYDGYQG